VAGELVKKLDEVWAKELALDRTKGNKEKLTILGQHMWGCFDLTDRKSDNPVR
jgi:hypothetical protein